jgi:hypothetical protein
MNKIKWKENTVLKMELETPVGNIVFLAIVLGITGFEIWVYEDDKWICKRTDIFNWSIVMGSLGKVITEIVL